MNFATLDLNLLRVLDALLREGSTTRAGQRVGLSQPAVSAALGRLRHALGDPLFVRHGNALAATDYATSIAVPLREALDRLEAVLTDPAQFDPMSSDAIFRISGSDFFAEMLMPVLAERLQRLAPRMRVSLVDLVPDSYVDTLERYEVDLGLVPDTEFPEWADHRELFTSAFVVVARDGHPRIERAKVAEGGALPLDLFCDLGHVLFSPEGRLQALGDAALAKVGRTRRVVMTMPVFSGVWRAVAKSDLVALLPEQLARRIAPVAGLRIYTPPMPISTPRIVMFWHKRSTANPAHAFLRNLIAEVLRELDEAD